MRISRIFTTEGEKRYPDKWKESKAVQGEWQLLTLSVKKEH
jgi:hypothetical protein